MNVAHALGAGAAGRQLLQLLVEKQTDMVLMQQLLCAALPPLP